VESLKDKVAIVTGASAPQGIGRAIARRYAEGDASLYLVADGTEAQLQDAVRECRERSGARAEYAVLDLGVEGAAETMVAEADRLFGRVDVLVNNAGVRARKSFGEFTRADFNRAFAVNLAAPFFASQAVVPIMRRQGAGRIVHIASQMGLVTNDQRMVYGTTKAGLIYLAKAMAYELAAENIVVNAISPGPILTDHNQALMDSQPDLGKRRLSYIRANRFGKPEEIAEVAFFLATTPATFLQGDNIVVDGGYVTH